MKQVLIAFSLAVVCGDALADPSAQYLKAHTALYLERPTAADFQETEPSSTTYRPIEGQVILDCLVLNNGRLQCEADKASSHSRLAEIALRVSLKFRLVATADGVPTAGRRIRIPIAFRNE